MEPGSLVIYPSARETYEQGSLQKPSQDTSDLLLRPIGAVRSNIYAAGNMWLKLPLDPSMPSSLEPALRQILILRFGPERIVFMVDEKIAITRRLTFLVEPA